MATSKLLDHGYFSYQHYTFNRQEELHKDLDLVLKKNGLPPLGETLMEAITYEMVGGASNHFDTKNGFFHDIEKLLGGWAQKLIDEHPKALRKLKNADTLTGQVSFRHLQRSDKKKLFGSLMDALDVLEKKYGVTNEQNLQQLQGWDKKPIVRFWESCTNTGIRYEVEHALDDYRVHDATLITIGYALLDGKLEIGVNDRDEKIKEKLIDDILIRSSNDHHNLVETYDKYDKQRLSICLDEVFEKFAKYGLKNQADVQKFLRKEKVFRQRQEAKEQKAEARQTRQAGR